MSGSRISRRKRRVACISPKPVATLRDRRRVRLLVLTDRDICGGHPVFRGTRVPVRLIAELLAQGSEPAELIRSYPRLTAEMIRLAPLCAATYPLRGSEHRMPWRDQQPVHRARRRLPD